MCALTQYKPKELHTSQPAAAYATAACQLDDSRIPCLLNLPTGWYVMASQAIAMPAWLSDSCQESRRLERLFQYIWGIGTLPSEHDMM